MIGSGSPGEHVGQEWLYTLSLQSGGCDCEDGVQGAGVPQSRAGGDAGPHVRMRACRVQPARATRHARNAGDKASTSYRESDPALIAMTKVPELDSLAQVSSVPVRTAAGRAGGACGGDVGRQGFAPARLPVKQEPVGASPVGIPVSVVRE
jgi:hypothetical protein